MDWINFQQALLATSTAVLPNAALLKWVYPLFWATLLAWLALALGHRLRPGRRLALAALVVLWTLVPGSASPVYWLGLAFQLPSLTSVLLALAGIAAQLRRAAPVAAAPLPLLLLAAGAGWILLLDMLVLLPFALYRWGFSVVALVGALALAVAVMILFGPSIEGRPRRTLWPWLLPTVLVLFVATRLPSGNVFDALLDPWLWLAAQVALVKRFWRVNRRASPTTRG
jgi:hypothetical protein